jgi:hypothetical protein
VSFTRFFKNTISNGLDEGHVCGAKKISSDKTSRRPTFGGPQWQSLSELVERTEFHKRHEDAVREGVFLWGVSGVVERTLI